MNYPNVARLFFNQPLACHPRAAMNVYNVLSGRMGFASFEQPETSEGQFLDRLQVHQILPMGKNYRASRFEGEFVRNEGGKFPTVEPFMLKGGTAIISIVGELANRGAFVGSNSGIVSYEGIRHQLKRAAMSPKVQNIVLDIELPGGQAVGVFELTDYVRAVSAVKPVYASVNGMAASGAYSIASGAKRIITGRTGVTGSIGVMMVHMDVSAAAEKMGVKPTLIFAGSHKADGNPYEALSDSVAADLQAEVNAFYQSFIDTVAAGRGRRLSKKAARDTEARTFIGQDAVAIGLADAVGTFDEVLDEANAMARRASAPAKPVGRQANAGS